MTELPEKKALKLALSKLKSKTITSTENYENSSGNLTNRINGLIASVQKEMKGEEKQEIFEVFLQFMCTIRDDVRQLIVSSAENVENWKMYTEVLEQYSSELDSTLTKIFEDAIKQSTEQIEKQKELVGKKPEYTI